MGIVEVEREKSSTLCRLREGVRFETLSGVRADITAYTGLQFSSLAPIWNLTEFGIPALDASK